MKRISNYEGFVFGKLLVRLDLGMVDNQNKTCKRRMVLAECLNCSSGFKSYILSNLKPKKTQSCGCLQKEAVSKKMIKHNKSYTSIYSTWVAMKQRYFNPNDVAYKNYGGRGITVCDSWVDSFENFLNDMGDRPSNFELDRIDNNKGYSPDNCRWSTKSQNTFNKRLQANNKSGKTGVHFNKNENKWVAQIPKNGKIQHLGIFKNIEDAIEKRKTAELEIYGFIKE